VSRIVRYRTMYCTNRIALLRMVMSRTVPYDTVCIILIGVPYLGISRINPGIPMEYLDIWNS